MLRDHVPLAGRIVMYIKAFKKNNIYISGYSMIYKMKLKCMSTDAFLRYKLVMRKPKDL